MQMEDLGYKKRKWNIYGANQSCERIIWVVEMPILWFGSR
jgi:hypothetical protein